MKKNYKDSERRKKGKKESFNKEERSVLKPPSYLHRTTCFTTTSCISRT
jgi:hypothetical protein